MRVLRSAKKPFYVYFLLISWFLVSSFNQYIQTPQPFESIAHRGASYYAPENTFAAFQKAVELGFDYIELDVRVTKDEQLVVIHDADVERTTTGKGYIGDLTIRELKELDAGSWFSPEFHEERIPLLEDILIQFGHQIGILIEMKAPEDQPEMIELLANALQFHTTNGLNAHSIKVQSFNSQAVKLFHSLVPTISTGILLNTPLDLLQLSSYQSFASFLSIHHQLLSKSVIGYAQKYGFEIFTWTIKKPKEYHAIKRLGVQGIITDEDFRLTEATWLLFARSQNK
ncbi:glycerophosphoryl diester phosphodiesterase [Cytobacillus eiseniae]|uniref:Glycerophosphoryl diester phosphodiesterase n=1 Tax=Cytobacillus eiseniae TaxID=762947 RepID=A0ABS4RER2_9BACI|nr:glycerophosphodiester phosphodiesterase family protein [Cytobacillus eiseniae]MBP2241223.1 glycerophosphoryl diester phosphodiesterase [Cytobacillus eiseniae]